MKYEIRQIDAWNEGENCWTCNESYHLGEFGTNAKNHKRAFLNALHKIGIVCKQGMTYISYDGDIYELRNRRTHEPLFSAIPLN